MSMSCSQVMAEYFAIKKQLLDLLEIPFALIAAAERLLAQAEGAAQELLDSALGMLDGISIDMPVGDLLNSLYRLLDCVFISASPAGAMIASAIDTIEEGAAMPEALKSYLKSLAQGYMDEAMSGIFDTPFGKLAELDAAYRGLINNPSVNAAMSALRDLENCVTALCEGYESGDFSFAELQEKLGAGVDNTVSSLTNAVKSVPDTAKEAAGTFTSNVNNLKASVAEASMGNIC